MQPVLLVLALLCVVPAVVAQTTLLGSTIAFQKAVYNINSGTTSYVYQVTTTANFLNYWVLGVSSNCGSPQLSATSLLSWSPIATDSATGVSGFRYAFSQKPNTSQLVTITFVNALRWGTGNVRVGFRAVPLSSSGTITGPSCASVTYNIPASLPAPTLVIPCSDPAAFNPNLQSTGFVSSTRVTAGCSCGLASCPYNFVEDRNYQFQTGSSALWSEFTQRVNVSDTVKPTLSITSQAFDIQCGDPMPALPAVTASDNCDPAPVIRYTEDKMVGSCPNNYFLTRTWTATDSCGNSVSASQTINVQDTRSPVLSGIPPSQTLQCPGSFLPVDNVTVSDYCGCLMPIGNTQRYGPYIFFQETLICGPCEAAYTLRREWRARDCCNNVVVETRTFTVQDATPPVISFVNASTPTTVVVECGGLPPLPQVTAEDDCDPSVTVTMTTETSYSTVCTYNYVVKRIWTATNACGLTATLTQTITVRDSQPPIIDSVPADQQLECTDPLQLQASQPPTAHDTCGTVVITQQPDQQISTACPNDYRIIRSWIVSDTCNNSVVVSQNIYVWDNTAPVFDNTSLPADATVQCSADALTLFNDVTPRANAPAPACSDNVTITYRDSSSPGTCPNNYVLTRTWTAVDCSSNSASASRHIQVHDTTGPQLWCDDHRCEDVEVDCADLPLAWPNVTASDNCDCPYEGAAGAAGAAHCGLLVSHTETTLSRPCHGRKTLQRRWTATDACGNPSHITQVVSVVDNTPPEWVEPLPPTHRWAECKHVPEDKEEYACSDVCSTCSSSFSETRENGTCEFQYTLTRVWTITDECGNAVNYTVYVYVDDTTAPSVDLPADVTVQCRHVPSVPELSALDNCDEAATVIMRETTDSNPEQLCESSYLVHRTWTSLDVCGNTQNQTQTITVIDTIAPVWEIAPTELPAIECDAQAAIDAPTPPNVNDNCGGVVSVHLLPVIDAQVGNPPCQDFERTYTWVATDLCGNQQNFSQSVLIHDTQAPQLTAPANTTVNCQDFAPPSPVWAPDVCEGSVQATYTDRRIDGECPSSFIMVYQWTATDSCGNVATAASQITVQDNEAPVLHNTPNALIRVHCNEVPSWSTYNVTATDNCDASVPVETDESREDGDCINEYVLIRTWTATDGCHTTVFTQEIHVIDNVAPQLHGVESDVTIECGDQLPGPEGVTASDNCDGVRLDNHTHWDYGRCDGNFSVRYSWTATDACGMTANASRTITVQDTIAPEWPVDSANDSVPCQGFDINNWPAQPGTPTDVCDQSVTVTRNLIDPQPHDPCSFTVVYQWIATDDCGNAAVSSFSRTVYDDQAPVAAFNITLDPVFSACRIPPVPSDTFGDNCDAEPTRAYNVEQTSFVCDYDQSLVRTWTYTDACGNARNYSQEVTVTYPHGPSLSAQPDDMTVECAADAVPAADTVTAVDGCGHALDVVFDEATIESPCASEYTVVRTWTAVDRCNFNVSHTQKINVVDTTPPVLSSHPLSGSSSELWCTVRPTAPALNASDVCNGEVPVTPFTHITEVCQYIFTANFTWTAVDCAGNPTEYTQIVDYLPANPEPTFYVPNGQLPGDTQVSCDAVPDAEDVHARDVCGNEIPTVFSNTSTGDACLTNLTRCWTAVDSCETSNVFCYSLSVYDNQAPVLHGVPEDKTVECGFIPVKADVTATDNCGTATVEFDEHTVQNDPHNCCNLTITRKWRAHDTCGLYTPWMVQVIHVRDTIPPILVGVPCDSTAECDAVPEPANVTAMNAPLAVGWCANADTQTSSWMQTTCGADATFPAATSTGSTATTFKFVPGTDGTDAVFLAYADDTATLTGPMKTAGGAACTLSFNLGNRVRFPAQSLALTRRLHAKCYKDTPTTGLTPVVDPSGWRIYESGSGVLTCGSTSFALTLSTSTAAQFGRGAHAGNFDQLGGEIVATYPGGTVDFRFSYKVCNLSSETWPQIGCDIHYPADVNRTIIPGNCEDNFTVIYTYSSADEAGNQVVAVQTISVSDTTPPVLEGVPGAITEACDNRSPLPTVTVTDNCDEDIVVFYDSVETHRDGTGCFDERRTWTATDICGNSVSQSQTVHVIDGTAPVLQGVPGNLLDVLAVQCNAIPDRAIVTASDTCDNHTIPVAYNETRRSYTCTDTFVIVRTWSASDDCGNYVEMQQQIQVKDTVAPVLSPRPADITYECGSPAPVLPTVSATDNCDLDVPVTRSNSLWERVNACTRRYKSTWTASDNCENVATHSQYTYEQDTQAPTWTSVLPAASITVECDSVPDRVPLNANDACDGALVAQPIDTITPGSCNNNYVITRRWSVADACGHPLVFTQTITVHDTTRPTITGVPADVTIECTEAIPALPDVCAQDNCNGARLTFVQNTQDACDGNSTIVRTWTATDDCGNQITKAYTITVRDTTAPVFDPTPASLTQECSNVQFPALPTASDPCSDVRVTEDRSRNDENAPCEVVWTLTYTATNDCGMQSQIVTTLHVVDTQAPVINPIPADITAECDAPAGQRLGAQDACQHALWATPSDRRVDSDVCPHDYIIYRKWTAADSCGNSATTGEQKITVADTRAPTFTSLPAHDVSVSCHHDLPQQHASAHDSCSTLEVYYNDTIVPGNCTYNYDIARLWTAVDACGNQVQETTYIHVYDNEEPRLHNVPSNVTVQCDGAMPSFHVTATDDCSEDLTVDVDSVTTAGDCDNSSTIAVTWTASDDCGNTVSATRYISIVDTKRPVFSGNASEPEYFDCPDWSEPADQHATDNCDRNVDVVRTTNQVQLSLPTCDAHYYIDYTYTATDNCGNQAVRVLRHISRDITPPTISGMAANATVECDQIPFAVTPTAHDECQLAAEPLQLFETNSSYGACTAFTITRTWVATDACGNSASATQVLVVEDTGAPTWTSTPPADVTVQCDAIPAVYNLQAADSCSEVHVDYTHWDEPGPQNCSNSKIIVRQWSAEDACGNPLTYQQRITVRDDHAPTILNVPASQTLECGPVPDVPEVCARDGCAGVDLLYSEERIDGSCDFNYQVVRRWDAVDDCGNSASASYTITVQESTAPVFDEPLPPAAITVECNLPVPDYTVTAQGECGPADVSLDSTTEQGDCAANYTIHRTWTALTDCNSTTSTSQTITVQDSEAPYCREQGRKCINRKTVHGVVWFYNVSTPESLFHCFDNCSTVTVTLQSCTSDQDAWAAQTVSGNYYLDAQHNFNQHCQWDVASDTLTISTQVDERVPQGRFYTITGYAEDACGHVTPVERVIWVPRDNNSSHLVPTGPLDEACFDEPIECSGICPCEYSAPQCADVRSDWEFQFLEAYVDDSGLNTRYHYQLRAPETAADLARSPIPSRVTLGIDLRQTQVVDVYPSTDVTFGFHADTHVSGIHWPFSADLATLQADDHFDFWVVVRGRHVENGTGIITVILGGGADAGDANPCARTFVRGPADEPTYTALSVEGGVFLDGLVSDVNTHGLLDGRVNNLGVRDIIVALVDVSGAIVARVMTDQNGRYAFRGVPNDDSLRVVITADSLLNEGESLNARYLAGPPSSTTLDYHYGTPVAVSFVDSNDLYLYFNDARFITETPVYRLRAPIDNNFVGDSRTISYWSFQLTSRFSGYSPLDESAGILQVYINAWASTGSCPSAPILTGSALRTVLSSGSPLEKCYNAAGLNHVRRGGLFEPYRAAQRLALQWIGGVTCNSASLSVSARDEALDLCARLLNAH